MKNRKLWLIIYPQKGVFFVGPEDKSKSIQYCELIKLGWFNLSETGVNAYISFNHIKNDMKEKVSLTVIKF